MNRPPPRRIHQRARAILRRSARPRRAARHIVANVLVTLEASRARATARSCSSRPRCRGRRSLAAAPLIGSYEDTLVRSEGWRFANGVGASTFGLG